MPICSRLYGDTMIGYWAFINTIATLIVPIADFGLTNAIMVETDDLAAAAVYRVSTTFVLAVSIATGIVSLVCFAFIFPDSVDFHPLFTAGYLALAVYSMQRIHICYTYLNRQSNYAVLMKNPITTNISFGIVSTFLALLGQIRYGYHLGWIFGQFATIIHMRRYLPRRTLMLRKNDLKAVIKRNSQFVTMQMPTNILNQIKGQIPSLLINFFFGVEALGQYSITMRLIYIPINLLGTSIGRVFFQTSSDLVREGKSVGDFTYKSLSNTMKIGIFPMVAIMAAGDVAINIFLGEGWQVAGIVIRILVIQAFFSFLNVATQGLYITINKQRYGVICGIAQATSTIVAITTGAIAFNSLYIGMALLALGFVVIQVVFFCSLFKAMGEGYGKYIRNALGCIAIIFSAYALMRFPLLLLNLVSTW